MAGESFYDVLTAAISDIAANGYDSQDRIAYWSQRIRDSAAKTMASEAMMAQMLRDALAAVYSRMVDKGQALKLHPGIARFTIERVRPALRAELDRRIMAAADLIKLNRKAAIDKTLQRFAGWSTSIPAGGSDAADKGEAKTAIRKSLSALPFEERRVLIDQGHKLRASISEVLAKDGRALAGVWNSHWRQAGYNFRPDHKDRDLLVYAVRGSWAIEAGLVKQGAAGYYDEITAAAEEPFCRCYIKWLYNLRDLPEDMLTGKGRAALDEAQARLRA